MSQLTQKLSDGRLGGSLKASMWMLIVLTAINICNAMDRTLISVLLPNIKAELAISDSQIGLLTGVAFALFYATLGLPLGLLSERVNRTKLISVALVTWSIMTGVSGLATGFFMLLFLRIGVAVGEAGGSPPSYGMIADAVRREDRTFAMSIFTSAGAFGSFLALFAGGWINEWFGWRVTFIVAGVFGLLLLPLILCTIKDPERGRSDGVEGHSRLDIKAMAECLFISPTFRHLVFGGTLSVFVVYSMAIWLPSFLSRSFHLSSGEIGSSLGFIMLFTGLAGTFAGGEIARRAGRKNLQWWGLAPVIGFCIAVPSTLLAIFSFDFRICLVGIALSHFGTCFYMGPLYATVGTIVPPGMRSVASSALLFCQMIIGFGLGPLLTGVASDLATARFGDEALRYALLLPVVAMAWAAIHYLVASRTIAGEAASAVGEPAPPGTVAAKESPI